MSFICGLSKAKLSTSVVRNEKMSIFIKTLYWSSSNFNAFT